MGYEAALSLSQRLADLRAAETAAEFFELFADDLSPPGAETMSVVLPSGWSINFRCAHLSPPLGASGDLDWTRVSRVKIVSVEQRT